MVALALCLIACTGSRPGSEAVDPSLGLTREDYRGLRARAPAIPAKAEPPIPSLRGGEVTASKTQDKPLPKSLDMRVSVTVDETVPLRAVFLELGRKAALNMELDSQIKASGVIFSAHEQPVRRVIERLCRMAGLRVSFDEDAVRIGRDVPRTQIYRLDYLSLARATRGEVGIATNVFAQVARGGGADAAGNNSTTKIEAHAEADFWAEIDRNLKEIVSQSETEEDAGTSKNSGRMGYTLNRQAGLVTVTAPDRVQERVATYLDRLRRHALAQVLIEARIIEVSLSENYRAGINWRSLNDDIVGGALRFGPFAPAGPFVAPTTAADGVMTLTYSGGDMAGIANLVRRFGTVRTLSSPRLTVLNNQTAILKVAENDVYFTSTVEATPVVGAGGAVSVTRTITSTPNTVPVGLVMTVQPAIDPSSGEITLSLRPTISRIVRRVSDPSVSITAAEAGVPVSSEVPVVEVREMDSVLRLHSGDVAVLGGLMQDHAKNDEEGPPVLDELPVLGALVKSRDESSNVSELVILLRATLAELPAPDAADRDLYTRYHADPRPLLQSQSQPPAAP